MVITKQALIIRHSASESLASNYTALLERQGFHLEPLNVFESAPRYDRFSAPDLRDVSLILVLGGPLSANDGYPALQQELAYIGDALAQAKPVFGVCLGSQLMAVALGATVEPNGRIPVRAAEDLRHRRRQHRSRVQQDSHSPGADAAR